MTVAFIVLAHRDPEQVARLAIRLAPHYVFLHVDAKTSDENYIKFVSLLQDYSHVRFLKRHRTGWASWGLVAAALEGLNVALQFVDWSHVMLLSGQDYPLLSSTSIDEFLNRYLNNSFVANWPLPSSLWGADGGLSRVRYWHFPFKGKRLFIPIARKHPKNYFPVGGSMYWCLNRALANEVVSISQKRTDVVNFYKHVWIPDELFIPTVVMNSKFKQSVINEGLTYIRWSTPGSPHPDELTAKDASELLKAGKEGSNVGGQARQKLFARKINSNNESRLLDMLDQNQ